MKKIIYFYVVIEIIKFYTNHYLIDNLSDIIYNEEYQKALKLENIEPNLNQWTKFLYRN